MTSVVSTKLPSGIETVLDQEEVDIRVMDDPMDGDDDSESDDDFPLFGRRLVRKVKFTIIISNTTAIIFLRII